MSTRLYCRDCGWHPRYRRQRAALRAARRHRCPPATPHPRGQTTHLLGAEPTAQSLQPRDEQDPDMTEHSQAAPDPVSAAPEGVVTASGVWRLLTWILTVVTRRHRDCSASDGQDDSPTRLASSRAFGGRVGSAVRQPSAALAKAEPSGTGGNTTSCAASVLPQRVRDAVLAEYHAENARRASDAVAELIRAGYHLGPVPYGYRAVRVHGTARARGAPRRVRLVADPVTAPVVTAIFHWRVYERLGHAAILARLTADPRRYKAPLDPATGRPGTWSTSTIRHILANPRYTGRQVHGRRVAGRAVAPEAWVCSAPGAHQPWVDDAIFARAQQRTPRRETTGLGRAA